MPARFSFAHAYAAPFHCGVVSVVRARASLSPPPEPFKSDDAGNDLLTTEQKFFLDCVRREIGQYSKAQLQEKLMESLRLMMRKDTLLKRTVFRWSDYTGE